MKRTVIVLLCLLVSGCVSIPLSTMWRLSQFTADDLANLDPAGLGVAVDLPDALSLDSARTALKIDLYRETETGEEDTLLAEIARLTTVETGRQVITPLRPASDGRHWHVMRLDSEAQASFRRFQHGFQKRWSPDDGKYFRLVVNPHFSGEDSLTGAHEITVALRLDPADGWFVLLDEAEMDFDELRRADTDSQQ